MFRAVLPPAAHLRSHHDAISSDAAAPNPTCFTHASPRTIQAMEVAPANPEGLLRGLAYVSISWVTFSIGLVLVSLRMWVRATHRNIGWDDWLIVAAVVCHCYGTERLRLITDVPLGGCILWFNLQCLSSCQRSWKTHYHPDPGRAVGFREVDIDS